MAQTTSHEPDYIPGLGRGFLTPLYDTIHRLFGVGGLHRLMIGLADPQPGMRVVDLGCATGNLLITLAEQRSGLDLVGVDPDPAALARAARKSRRRRLTVDWQRGFGQSLALADASVDRAFSSLMLHHLDEAGQDAFLAEVRRVLRPDGLLVLADMSRPGPGNHGHTGRHNVLRHVFNRATPGPADPHLVARLADAGFRTDVPSAYPIAGLTITVVRAHP
jgi:ubiquinone/menaquinone biosynthesis C-methylase UbiE